MELKEFLASDEGESSDSADEDVVQDRSSKKQKKQDLYRALLQSGDGSEGSDQDEEENQDMEITFNTGLEDLSKRILEKKDRKSESVWEAYLRKRREKKKSRKNRSKNSSEDESSDSDEEHIEESDDFFVEESVAKGSKKTRSKNADKEKQEEMAKEAEASRAELELLLADDKGTDANLKGYNLKRKKLKGKRGKEAPDEEKLPAVDYDDPRFAPLFNSPLFALDPTDPQFKRYFSNLVSNVLLFVLKLEASAFSLLIWHSCVFHNVLLYAPDNLTIIACSNTLRNANQPQNNNNNNDNCILKFSLLYSWSYICCASRNLSI